MVRIEPDDLRIRQAEICDNILDIACQHFFEGLDIQMLTQWSCHFDGAKASHFDLVRM
jgi:hypothetical protein